MLASPLPPSFQDTYSLSTSYLGCNALCMVISFLVLWSICLSWSLVLLRKGPEYLSRRTTQVFIPLMRFLLASFVSSSFLFLLSYSFRILSFICTCLMVSASRYPSICRFHFLREFSFYRDLVVPFFSHMWFATFHDEHGTFFYAKFHSNVLTLYSNGVYESFQFFLIFCR